MSGNFAVGQVIYVISRKESRVYPVLVVEETVRKTLEGTAVTYMVQLPDKKATVVPLDGISDKAFSRADDLRDFLITSATKSINTMVDDAVKIGHVLAPAGDVVPEARDVQPSEDGVIMVDLPDGTKARLRAPNVPVQS
jgi:hypothetical protein